MAAACSAQAGSDERTTPCSTLHFKKGWWLYAAAPHDARLARPACSNPHLNLGLVLAACHICWLQFRVLPYVRSATRCSKCPHFISTGVTCR